MTWFIGIAILAGLLACMVVVNEAKSVRVERLGGAGCVLMIVLVLLAATHAT